MLELDFRQAGEGELSFVGLVPELSGQGHGRWLQLSLLASVCACSSQDTTRLFDPRLGSAGPRPAAFLNLPSSVRIAPLPSLVDQSGFPRQLSATGAFRDVAELAPAAGIIPYDLRAPLWSDGSYKQRWVALPELGQERDHRRAHEPGGHRDRMRDQGAGRAHPGAPVAP